jgi:transposase
VTARRDVLGRQPKLDGALIDLVGEHLRAGLSIARTCLLLGVSKASYYSWVAKAHETTGRGIHGQFLAVVRRGLAEYEVRLLSAITEATHGDPAHGIAGQWQAAAWTLERKFPHRYGTQADRLEGIDLLDGPAIESSDGGATGQSP